MPIISEFPIAGPQGKQGPAGPQGKQGPEGKRGPMGPAGPGTGDMLAMVYDPQGKATDVYKYIDDATAGRADLTLSNLSNRQKALRNIGGRPNRNLLDNAHLAGGGSQQGGGQFPINQRGETSYSGSGVYTIDRWKNVGNAVTTINDDGVSFTAISNANLRQFCGIPNLDGLTLTASILYKSVTSGTCHLIIRNSKDAELKRVSADSAGLVTTTFQVPQGSGRLSFESNAHAGIGFKLIAAKIELGPTQTLAYQDEDGNWQLFETPDYAEELAKCQRYQYCVNGNNRGLQSINYIGPGIVASETNARVPVQLPVTPRVKPTVSFTNCELVKANGEAYVITDMIVMWNASGNYITLQAKASGMPTGEMVYVRVNGTSGRILFDMNL